MKSLAVLCLLALIAHSTLAKPQGSAPGQKPRLPPDGPFPPREAPQRPATQGPTKRPYYIRDHHRRIEQKLPNVFVDSDHDGVVTVDEVLEYIELHQIRGKREAFLRKDTDKAWAVHAGENQTEVTWESYAQKTYGRVACPVKGQIKDASGVCVCRQGSALNADGSKCERVKQN